MLLRRFIGISAVLIATIVMVPLAPIVIGVAWLIAKTTQWRSLHRAILFAYGFLFYEISGIVAMVWIGLRHRDREIVLARSYNAQRWWAHGLFNLAVKLFNLKFEVTGQEAIAGDGTILISRHTNIADNVFPLVFVSTPRQKPVRYILKKELQSITSLDIGGNRLPNLFIDRSGLQTQQELERVRDLLLTCDKDDSLLIYPEGTRFSPAKQASLKKRTNMAEQVERWPSLLPPRLGGITTLLEANSDKDVVFLCHNGFEGSGGFRDLIDGAWLNTDVHLHFWRIPFEEIGDDYQAFIFNQWDRMQATLTEMRA